MAKCPVCGMMVDESTAPSSEYEGKKYYFHEPEHKIMFDKAPKKFLNQEMGGMHGNHSSMWKRFIDLH